MTWAGPAPLHASSGATPAVSHRTLSHRPLWQLHVPPSAQLSWLHGRGSSSPRPRGRGSALRVSNVPGSAPGRAGSRRCSWHRKGQHRPGYQTARACLSELLGKGKTKTATQRKGYASAMGLCNPPAAGRAVPWAEGQCLPGPVSSSAASSRPAARPGELRVTVGVCCVPVPGAERWMPQGREVSADVVPAGGWMQGEPLGTPQVQDVLRAQPFTRHQGAPTGRVGNLGWASPSRRGRVSRRGPFGRAATWGGAGLGVGGCPAAPRSSHSWAGLPGGGVAAAGAGRQECKHRRGGEERRLCLLRPHKPGCRVHETPSLSPPAPAAGDVGVPGDGGGPVTCVVPKRFPLSH